jgi:hypothetical protein
MKEEGTEQVEKRCPLCARGYSEEDNYCGDDGSALEQTRVASGKRLSKSAGMPMTADDVTDVVGDQS